MSAKPLKPSSIDVSKLDFGELRSLGDHAKAVYVNFNKSIIHLQSPELEILFDSGKMFEDQKRENSGKFSVRVSLKDFDKEGSSTKAFHDMMVQMDEVLKEAAKKNSQAWFKKKNISDDVMDEIYNEMVKVSKDSETGEPNGKFPPSFTFKVIKRDGEVLCKCFDGSAEGNPVLNINDPEGDDYRPVETLLNKKTKVKMLLQCNGIWIVGGKFGCTWKAVQMRVTPAPGFEDYAFLDDSDNEEDVSKIEENFVQSDDDEKTDEEEEEVVKTPPKKVRKAKRAA